MCCVDIALLKRDVATYLRNGLSGVRISAEARNFFSSPKSRDRSGTHPVFYSMCTKFLAPGLKWSECEVGHSAPSSNEVKKDRINTSNIAGCLHGVGKGILAFLAVFLN